MKFLLRYQASVYDCCPTSFINAFIYLLDIEDINVEILKGINSLTLDLNEFGTSREAVEFLCNWIRNKTDAIDIKYLKKKEVEFFIIKRCIEKNGCVIYRTYLKNEHYVLITAIDKKYIYVFDPFYYSKYYKWDFSVKIIKNNPIYNRRIKLKRFLGAKSKDFSLGIIINRECVLINKKL